MSAAGQSGAAVDMPVRAVALYNNGYGVFERKAVVSGRGSIELYFREADMKDVLQSLTFRYEGHGICTKKYDIFPFQLRKRYIWPGKHFLRVEQASGSHTIEQLESFG